MATIIDFSPSALETESVAEAARSVKADIPAPPLPTISIPVDLTADRDASRTFHKNSPDILFVAEYAPAGTMLGALVVWEAYYNATHYELYRKNLISADQSWTRMLFLDSNNLANETARFAPYIQDKLGLAIPGGYFAILDGAVKRDRIYQYKLVASYYPKNANVDYESILQSKGLVNAYPITSNGDTVFDFSNRAFGTPDYAWVVALLNNGVQYFGRNAATKPLSSFLGPEQLVFLPKALNQVLQLIAESVYFFGIVNTVSNLLNRTRDQTEISSFYSSVLASINVEKNVLSYSALQTKIMQDFPAYQHLNSVLQKAAAPNTGGIAGAVVQTVYRSAAATIPVQIPTYDDTTSFDNFGALTLMFLRLNTILISAVYAQDNDTRIQSIINIQGNPTPPAPPVDISKLRFNFI